MSGFDMERQSTLPGSWLGPAPLVKHRQIVFRFRMVARIGARIGVFLQKAGFAVK
jgi:hypothetical protein